jgi:uncharacterized protein YndB with AHSA1/START domain
MTYTARLQVAAPPDTVFQALTDPVLLTRWLAEHADVSLPDGRFEFWGRYTPGGAERGRQRLLDVEASRRLRFGWDLDGAERTVDIALEPVTGGTVVTVTETDADGKPLHAANFWDIALANLDSQVTGHRVGLRYDHRAGPPDTAAATTVIDAPPATVFAALLDPAQLRQWMRGGESVVVEPTVGGRYDLGWDHGPVRVLELVPDRVLAYSWRYPDSPDTVVRWELVGSDGGTGLTVVHSGFADPGLAEEYRQGWPGFLVGLKRHLELGPDREPLLLWFAGATEPWRV